MTNNFEVSQRPGRKLKFTTAEDSQLVDLVRQWGDSDWSAIACSLPGRNPRQCRERWRHYLSPNVLLAPFSAREDALLLQKFEEFGRKWKAIAAFFPGRTDIALKNRYLLLVRRQSAAASQELPKPAERKEKEKETGKEEIPWSDEEDPARMFQESTDLIGDYYCLNGLN
jgi:hypothetical protein